MDGPRRRSIRLRGYDYAQGGAYFVTICTDGKACLFGDIVDDEMQTSSHGIIVGRCWEAIPTHFPNVELDAFVVMPNHVHGIVVITEGVDGDAGTASPRGHPCPYRGTVWQAGGGVVGDDHTVVQGGSDQGDQ